jgi:serine/threonine protein phosphatase PrpC
MNTLVQEQRIGMRRANQDYAAHFSTGQALLLTVADGMSGYFGGELAAEIAVGSVLHSFCSEAQPRLAAPGVFLERAFARAHVAIEGYAHEKELLEVPRTVIVACVVQEGYVWWNHVGDSRLYLVREGRIEAQTKDHTQVQEMVDAGEVLAEQAYSHPESSRVLQSLGAPIAPKPGPGASARLHKDDILLLCSDGFWGPLRTGQLLRGLEGPSLRQSVAELSDVAERRAGSHGDNLTVLAMRWPDEKLSTTTRNATWPDSRDDEARHSSGTASGARHSETRNR